MGGERGGGGWNAGRRGRLMGADNDVVFIFHQVSCFSGNVSYSSIISARLPAYVLNDVR